MELTTIKDAFDRVVKKQKLSSSKSLEVIDQVGHEIQQALSKIQSANVPFSPIDRKSILAELKLKLDIIGPTHQLECPQKELNINLSKYPKLLEKSCNPDISKAYKNAEFDFHLINQIIANHFYQQGLFDLGDSMVYEAGEPKDSVLKYQFFELYQILEAMQYRNLEPALNWVSTNHEKLKQIGSNLELKLRSLQYVEILQEGTLKEALSYAKAYLAPLALTQKDEIMKLMGCLVFRGRLSRSPYSEIISPLHWQKLTEELIQQFCYFLGLPSNSPLGVAIAAGFEGLHTLLKLANVMSVKKQEWQAMKQLPVPLELSKEFQFHSIFVCPVSRDQSGDDNPPMLMPCLHVLCKQSILKLSKSSTRAFKCPYCPAEASVALCRQLYF